MIQNVWYANVCIYEYSAATDNLTHNFDTTHILTFGRRVLLCQCLRRVYEGMHCSTFYTTHTLTSGGRCNACQSICAIAALYVCNSGKSLYRRYHIIVSDKKWHFRLEQELLLLKCRAVVRWSADVAITCHKGNMLNHSKMRKQRSALRVVAYQAQNPEIST